MALSGFPVWLVPLEVLPVSQAQTTVAFKFDYSDKESGGGWNAVGASTPTSFSAGDTYTFNFQNNTENTSFNYDISCFSFQLVNGNVSGVVSPGQTVTVSIYKGYAGGDGEDENAASFSLQAGAAPLLTFQEGTVCFWFSTDGSATDYQQIAICNNSQSSFPFTSTSTQTTTQMTCESSSAGLSVGLGGGGGECTTGNIWIQVDDVAS